MRKDVIVIGGGVIGCSIAWQLARAGVKVALWERGKVGGESSRAAAGMLSPQAEAHAPGPFFDLCMRSRAAYPEFASLLAEASGIDVEYRDEGALSVFLRGEDETRMADWTRWQIAAGLRLERVGRDELSRIEPAVTKQAAGAIFIPGDHQVENRRLMDALAVAMEREGVEVIEGRAVDSLVVEQERVTGVVCGTERFHARAVVVAAGSWSGRLLEPVGLKIKVIPARGQMLAVRGEGAAINHTLHSSGCYLVPRSEGRILIGATVEYVGFEKGITVGGIGSLISAAIEMVPALAGSEIIETWSGLRPDTPDHLPVIGASRVENLFVATGHFRNGILLAPVTARAIVEAITYGRAPEGMDPFGIERFGRAKA